MKSLRLPALLNLFLALIAVPSFAHHMAVVVAQENQVSNLTSPQLSKIFRAETRKWPDGKEVVIVLHRASAGEAVTLQKLNKMSAAQFQSWIIEHKNVVKLVDSDQDVLTVVESTPGAVGMVEVRSVNDRIKVVRIDGKMPMEEGYLSH